MENTKVEIVNMTNHEVNISLPDLRFKRVWPKKNAKISVDRGLLEDMMLDPGVEYMFRSGMLFIKDMKTKQELGLEPEDAKEPVNIIVLSDEQKKRYMTVMPAHDFKEAVKKLGREQQRDLVEFAVENELLPYDKCKILEELTGTNPMRKLELDKQAAEE